MAMKKGTSAVNVTTAKRMGRYKPETPSSKLPAEETVRQQLEADTPIGFSSLREALDLDINPNLTFTSSSPVENIGLALVADDERLDPDSVIRSMTHLLYSPMFWMVAGDFQTSTQGVVSYTKQGEVNDDDAASSLRLLCARMFLAGVYAAPYVAGRNGVSRKEIE